MSVTRIVSPLPYDSNIYLVKGDSAIIIDSGTGLAADDVIRSIRGELGSSRVSALILTHCHMDHSGGANSLSVEFSCPIHIGAGDAASIRNADRVTTVAGFFLNDRDALEPVECREIREGDVFDVGEHRLRAIDTPGHTSGGISLYDEVTSSLFSGDTLFSTGYGRTDLPGGSMSALRESLQKLRDVNITTLYPGHGPVETDGKGSLAYALHSVGLL